MLQLGTRTYELIRAHSGFFLELDPEPFTEPRRQWRLEAHWVPSCFNDPLPDNAGLEYLRLTVTADRYHVSDWRELTGLGLEPRAFQIEL
jgi:hypothetical protein